MSMLFFRCALALLEAGEAPAVPLIGVPNVE